MTIGFLGSQAIMLGTTTQSDLIEQVGGLMILHRYVSFLGKRHITSHGASNYNHLRTNNWYYTSNSSFCNTTFVS